MGKCWFVTCGVTAMIYDWTIAIVMAKQANHAEHGYS